jgi:putative nucleotidyltransferase with HDIG domain
MITLPTTARNIITRLEKNGFEIYAVGGSVRDLLMGRPARGWDFTTNATPIQILELFPASFYDNNFGTVGIKIYHQENPVEGIKPDDIYEITTYRSESGYTDFRHPDKIAWGRNLEEDLSRRDFTINAIAFNGKKLIDPYHGQDDLKAKIIRCVGKPDSRFSEDALRMMRAVRIAAELGFLIEEDTRKAIINNAGLLSRISAERIRDELLKLLASDFAADGILILKNSGLLKIILPEFDASFSVGQKSPRRHHIFDVGTHSVEALKACPASDPIVRMATLLHDIGKPKTYRVDNSGITTFYNHEVIGARMVKTIAVRLRFSKKQTDKLYTLVRWHQFSVDERQTDSAIRRIIRRIGKENLEDMLALRIGDRLGGGARETSWRLELFKKRLTEVQKQPFTVADLKINGYDVMKEFNAKPGPLIGEILSGIFNNVEKGNLRNTREELLEKLTEMKKSGIPAAEKK